MSETAGVTRILMALGAIFLLVGLIIPGQDAPWKAMVTNLSTQSFPNFSNPFDQGGYSSTGILQEAYHYQNIPVTVNNRTNNDCGNITFYACLVDAGAPDYDTTYLQLNPANITQFNYTSGFYPDADANVRVYAQGVDWTVFNSFRVDLWCRWSVIPSNGNRTVIVVFAEVLDARNTQSFGANDAELCPAGATWGHVTFIGTGWQPAGHPSVANAFMQMGIASAFGAADGKLDISTAYVQVFFTGATTCNGGGFFGDLSCQLGNFFNWWVHAGQFVLNGIVFVGGIGWWFFNVVGILFTGFFSVIAFLFAVPGTPTEVQAVIDVVLTGSIAYILVSTVRLVRGGSGV